MDKLRSILFGTVFFVAPAVVAGPILNRRLVLERAEASREVLRATAFAAEKHKKQKRKNIEQEPYVNHVIRVAELVSTLGQSGDNLQLVQAALLHDTVEDTDTTLDEIQQHFGLTVRKLVEEVSDDKNLAKDVRKQLQIEKAPSKSREAKILSMADKVANVEDLLTKGSRGLPVGWSVERVQNYCEWATAVAAGLKGEALQLDRRLKELCSGDFDFIDGKRYKAMPPVDSSSSGEGTKKSS